MNAVMWQELRLRTEISAFLERYQAGTLHFWLREDGDVEETDSVS
jgi:hypothetical protein